MSKGFRLLFQFHEKEIRQLAADTPPKPELLSGAYTQSGYSMIQYKQ